jgi:hypothetical protein
MNTLRSLVLFCPLILAAACNNSSKMTGDIVVLNGIEAVKNTKELKLSDIAESIEYVKLETTPDLVLTFSTKIWQMLKLFTMSIINQIPTERLYINLEKTDLYMHQ